MDNLVKLLLLFCICYESHFAAGQQRIRIQSVNDYRYMSFNPATVAAAAPQSNTAGNVIYWGINWSGATSATGSKIIFLDPAATPVQERRLTATAATGTIVTVEPLVDVAEPLPPLANWTVTPIFDPISYTYQYRIAAGVQCLNYLGTAAAFDYAVAACAAGRNMLFNIYFG